MDRAEARGPLRDRERVVERATRLAAAREVDREHRAAAVEDARGDLRLGMAREAGVDDAVHAVLTLEERRECHRRPRLAFHAHRERRDAAQDEERRERPERRAGVDLRRADRGDPVPRPDDDARHHVRVPGQVLRRGLHHEVGAVVERPAHGGRGERVVDRQQRAVAVREVGEPRQVGEHAGRVRDRLDVEDPGGPGRERRLDRGGVGRVDIADVDAQPPERRDRLGPRRPVAHLPDEHPLPGPDEAQERGVDRGHAGRERDPGLGVVQLGDRIAHGHDRRVVDAAVRVPGLLAGEDRGQLLGVARGERRGLVDRDRRRRLGHTRCARGRADRARGRAGTGSFVGHRPMLHRLAATSRRGGRGGLDAPPPVASSMPRP